jgi:hypothetical protein
MRFAKGGASALPLPSSWGSAEMASSAFMRAVAYLFIAYIGVNVFIVSYMRPLGFDDAFNLQVAKSLSDSFIYQSTYYPRYIYDYRITTNGLMQYITALGLNVAGNRIALSTTLGIISIFSLLAVLKYSSRSFLALVVLLVSYPGLSGLMTTYLGEIFSLGFIFLGSFFIRRRLPAAQSLTLRGNILPAALCFGLAISTKLIAAVLIPFFVFALLYPSGRIEWRNIFYAVVDSLKVYTLAILFFVLFFYVSVLHSQLVMAGSGREMSELLVSSPGLLKFVQHHFWQQSTGSSYMLKSWAFSTIWIFPLVCASLFLLFVASPGWIPFAVFLVAFLLVGGMHERRIFLFIVPPVLFAADFAAVKAEELRARLSFSAAFRRIPHAAFLLVLGYALGSGLQRTPPLVPLKSSFDSTSTFSLVWPQLEYLKGMFAGPRSNDFVVKDSISKSYEAVAIQRSPIIVSSWWQFPDLQLRSGVSFYDRMDPGVSSRLKGASPLLLFNPQLRDWPETSIGMCTEIVVDLPDLVLCRYDASLPLNQRWGIQ